MKKILFGIALILYAFLLATVGTWIPFIGADWFILLLALVGVVIAGIGAFTKDK